MSRATKPVSKGPHAAAIGARLRVEREAHPISLEDFAQAVGMSINKVRWHEAGSRLLRADELAVCARILKLEPLVMMIPHYADREADMATRVALGRLMQSARALQNKRQHEIVAKVPGLTATDLHNHEQGARSLRIDHLFAVATVLKVEPAKLLEIA